MKAGLWILCLLLACGAGAEPRHWRGADVSSLPQVEAGGGVLREGELARDCLAILRAHGVDTVRLRTWHAPADGVHGTADTAALARRAARAGFRVLLDLHYSDTWADPGHQSPPPAWRDLDFAALNDSVRVYTRGVVAALIAAGAPPDLIQLGNEITGGLLWPVGRVDGSAAGWDRLAALLRSAAAGVTEACAPWPAPPLMVHLDAGGDNARCRFFLDGLSPRWDGFEVIGLSYYPWWHGGLAALEANLDDLAGRYGKDLLVVETAYPWTIDWFDDVHNVVGLSGQLLPGYPATPAGQRDFLAALRAVVAGTPAGHGVGVCWWEPAWVAAPGFGSGWENLTLFDATGAPLPALDVLGAAAP